ncbi:hypothetical protein KY289_010996 [Solanum tuberosum]|nr:hypothetical protein KY289_010996 [Solanum tuberosum]
MATSSDRPMKAAREGSGASISQPHALEGVGEHISNQAGPHPHMSHGTQTMNPHFQQMAESMHDPHWINFEKMRKMGGVEVEGTVDPTDAEQWLDRMEREKDKCRKFEDGLNDSIRKNVAILQHEKFCKLVSAAFTWERLDKKEASRNENRFRKPRPDFGGPSKRGRFDNSKAASTPNYGQGKPRVPTSPQCGKNHYGTCRRASGACFNYGSFDHKVKDCPNPNNAPSLRTEGSVHKPPVNPPQTNRGARPNNTQAAGTSGANQASGQRATARAYAMRQRDDQDGQDVVVGKVFRRGSLETAEGIAEKGHPRR